LPLDHDHRSNLCGSPGLTATPPLTGGEALALVNLTPGGGSLSVRLPRVRLGVCIEAEGREPKAVRPYLETVLSDTLRVAETSDVLNELAWRAMFPPPRQMKDATLVVTEEELG